MGAPVNQAPQPIIRAVLRNAPISPQKMRLAANEVVGLSVQAALDKLDFTTKKSCKILRKVIDSAVSNAEHAHQADIDELIISMVRVDKGLMMSRFFACARGRYGIVKKIRSHVEVRVGTEIDSGLTNCKVKVKRNKQKAVAEPKPTAKDAQPAAKEKD